MSKIDKLIEELCPDGVEYKSLEDIAEYRRGSFPQPYGNVEWYDGEGSMPFVQVADVSDDGFKLNFETNRKISLLAQPKSVFVKAGTVIVSLQGTLGRVAITQYDCYLDRTLAVFNKYKIDINKKYFAYQLKAKFDIKKKTARGSTLKTITKEEFSKFTLPLPPLPVQEEIVRILDNFTELTEKLKAELETELTARRKQYEYYRNELLTFGDEVEWKTLGESLKRTKGTSITARKMEELNSKDGEIRVFAGGRTYADVHYGDIPDKDINDNPSIIVKSRGNIEFEYYDKPFSHKNEFWSYYSDDEKLNIKFVYYFLQTKTFYFQHRANVMQMPQISIPVTDKFLIPIPPLAEQERIVSILDKFDALINDISIGLPAEIEARQKQYEYYREKLLTFKELEAKEA